MRIMALNCSSSETGRSLFNSVAIVVEVKVVFACAARVRKILRRNVSLENYDLDLMTVALLKLKFLV